LHICQVIPEFEHFMSPGILLTKMQRAGINIIPTNDDAKFCSKPLKTSILEAKVHANLADVVGVMDISASRYSSSQDAKVGLVKIRSCDYKPPCESEQEKQEVEADEAPAPAPTKEELAEQEKEKERQELLAIITKETVEDRKLKKISDDTDGWRTVLITETKCLFPNATKFAVRKKILEEAEGQESHFSLRDCITKAMPEKTEAFDSVPCLLQRNVRKTLNVVRLMVFH